jgi:chromosome segregation ATPase
MTTEQYEEKIAQLEANVDDLDAEVEELNGTLQTMQDERAAMEKRISTLEDDKDTLAERVSELEDALKGAERGHEAALRAIDALRTYLSWTDNPPPKMDGTEYQRFLAAFRHDLDAALREVP